jgi:hypothetical protein
MRTEQNRTEQNRTEQNRTEQNRTEQNSFVRNESKTNFLHFATEERYTERKLTVDNLNFSRGASPCSRHFPASAVAEIS